jgi:trigger factor
VTSVSLGMNTPTTKLVEKDGNFIVSITVPTRDVEDALNSAASAIMPSAEVPGFRPGHTPLPVIRQHYSTQLKTQVSAKLVQEATRTALKQLSISAGARPTLDGDCRPRGIRKWLGKFDINGSFSFSVVTPVPPRVEAVCVDGLNIDTNADDSSRAVDEQLHHLRHDFVIKTVSELPSADGDEVVCSITATDSNGQEIPDLRLTSFPLSMDLQASNMLSKTMAQHLLGKRPGDIAEFSEDGTTYRMAVESVSNQQLPPLDDEFAVKCGFTSLADLRQQVLNEWFLKNAGRVRRALHLQVREQLVKNNPFEVPSEWLADYDNKVRGLAQNDETLQGADAAEFARVYAASDYLLELLEDQFPAETTISDVDLIQYAKEELATAAVKPEDYIKFLVNNGQYDSWVIQQKKTKTLDWLISRSNQ